MHLAALTQPVSTVTNLLIQVCEATGFSIYATSCYEEFSGIGGLGPYWAQLFAKMSLATGDFQAFCAYQFDVCDPPANIEIDESQYFSPKPESANVGPEPSGELFNVLHLSDWHLDPRYDIGSEADCSQYLCCRPYSTVCLHRLMFSFMRLSASFYQLWQWTKNAKDLHTVVKLDRVLSHALHL